MYLRFIAIKANYIYIHNFLSIKQITNWIKRTGVIRYRQENFLNKLFSLLNFEPNFLFGIISKDLVRAGNNAYRPNDPGTLLQGIYPKGLRRDVCTE